MTTQLHVMSSSRRKLYSTPSTRTRLKILILRVRLLYPQNSGGKIRTAKLIEEIAKDNDITMVAYRYPEDSDDDVARTARHCAKLVTVPYHETPKHTAKFYMELAANALTTMPYIIGKYSSPEMASTVERLYKELEPDLILVDFLQACEGLRRLGGAPFVLFQHNVESAIFDQLAGRAESFWTRTYLKLQARRLRRYERRQCRRARRVIAVSEVDQKAFQTDFGVTNCDVVPTGVDTQYFRPSGVSCRVNNLVFTGSMDWIANQDAVKYFVHEIFPLIRKEIPNVVFSIVGRNPPKEIQQLGERPGITVTGTVSDIRPYVHSAKVYIVPLRIGSGTRIKLLEAMALGKATVSTSIGAEGLPVEHGKNIVLADDAQKFAEETVNLLRNESWRTTLEKNARALVERDYSWVSAGRILSDICYRSALKIKQE